MANRYNPFKPNHPIFGGLFAGRYDEIERIDNALFQTSYENPTNLLFLGERGIGKTSLLLLSKYFANGEIKWNEKKHNFLTIQINLTPSTTIIDLIIKIKKQLEKELHKINSTQKIIDNVWKFIKRIEVSGFKINETASGSREQIIDDFTFSLSETVKKITSGELSKDGIVILIDESDTANQELGLGSFLKNLTETLVSENSNKVLFILTGLPIVVESLTKSHESSLRLFEKHQLKPLEEKDVKYIINKAIEDINSKSPDNIIKMENGVIEKFYELSEGYPHFLQQIGFSAISDLETNILTAKIVENAMYKKGGALDLIGRRYYSDLFYNKINVESYRQILKIMANKWNQWISKTEIRKEFTGSGSELNNGINALRKRNIILTKKGVRGVYRLQWMSFAFWIRTHNMIY